MRRVRRPKDQEAYYTMLVDKEEYGIFSTYKDIFMLAGLIGFFYKRKKSFDNSTEGISWNVFNLNTDEIVIDMVAIKDTKDLDIINPDRFDDKITIFEEYAAGGLERIMQVYNDSPSNFTDNLYDFLLEMEGIKDSSQKEFNDITKLLY
ncbi:DNA phosphorothioation-associated protein 4 [Salipaludibacillus daqingensis]|uniref:DNA phosphorothioation-associated protein 4 n=1 Tax=Salipaludibacillus daqingensis TaxID=3041001 RepID=UPI0024746E32|nr:DNA phosphorothioation-associated protein 4 [Salipaludibacillus daqingensis]